MVSARVRRVVGVFAIAVAAGDLPAHAALLEDSPENGSGESAREGQAERERQEGLEEGPVLGANEGSAFTIRLQLPFTQAIEWRRDSKSSSKDGGFALLGGSVSRRFYDIIEAEAGAAIIINPCAHGPQATLRLGVTPSLSTPVPEGSHWNVRIPVLASAHFASLSGDGCDGHTELSGRVLDVASGIDATRWGAAGVGFNLRLLVGYGFDGLAEASLALGMAF